MCTVVIQDRVRIPDRVRDLDSFCRWATSDEYPELWRISFLNGEVWAAMGPEKLFTHNQVKVEFTRILGNLNSAERLGLFCPDGMLLRNDDANLSTEPDGTFVSSRSLKTGRVTVDRPLAEGCDVLVGSPDMVLEIVSDSSVRKDTVILRELYYQAGITEYWLVGVRGEELLFEILRRGRRGYTPVRKEGDWLKSKVFGRSLQLTFAQDELNHPSYTLLMR